MSPAAAGVAGAEEHFGLSGSSEVAFSPTAPPGLLSLSNG